MKFRMLLILALSVVSLESLAQTPSASPIGDESDFAGSQVCVDAPLTNTGSPGFAPYLQVIVPIGVTFDSAGIFGSSATTINVGTFPPAPGNQLTDTIIDAQVTAPQGFELILIQPPIGSLVDGAPVLNLELCFTIDPTAVVGVPLGVSVTPVFELGNTPTGNNGPIIGTPELFNITPILVEFMKENDAPEAERPPGPSWPVNYSLTADIAPGSTLDNVVITDTLPASFVLDVGSLMVIGGTGCVFNAPNITLNCTSATGTASAADLVVTYSGFFSDTLDEAVCDSSLETNNATFDADYLAMPITQETATTDISLQHITIQKGAGPGFVAPGDTVTYNLNLQVTDFGTSDGLILTDILPDGMTFDAHGALTVGVAGVAIVPTIQPDIPVNGQTTVTYDITAVTGNIAPGTAINVSYTSTVDATYFNGDAILANDPLTNTVVSTFDLTAGASGCNNGSAATVTVQPTTPTKTVITTGPYEPGDTVTYRLTLAIPSGDTQDVVFTDFFPLPVFDATNIDLTFGNDITNSPDDTLGLTPTLISADGATNSIRIEWPDVTTGSPQVLSVDIDVSITTDPFADNLNLANLLQIDSANSPGTTTTGVVPVSIQVRAPELVIIKGVLAADQGTIAPLPSILPVDGDLSDVDAGDSITYQITVENQGGAQAFDVVINDPAIPELTACAINSVEDGTSTGLAFTGDLVAGISLTNPLTANDNNPMGGGAPFSTDTVLVSITCDVAVMAEINESFENTATVDYAGAVGALAYPQESDTAMATTTNYGFAKAVLANSPDVDSNTNTATVGETIQYSVTITVPEGTGTNITVEDRLPNGFTFQTMDSMTASPGITTDVVGGFPAILTAASGGVGTRDATFDFGTLTNNNDSNNANETIVILYTVLVNDVPATTNGNRQNRARFFADGNRLFQRRPTVNIRQPNLTVVKTTVPTTADAGDTISYSIVVSNTGNSPAFDVDLEDLLADVNLSLVVGSVMTTQGTVTTGNNGGDSTVVVDIGTIVNSNNVTVTFDAVLGNAVVSGETVDNTASVTNYNSIPGGGRTYPDVEDDASVIINIADTVKTVIGATSTEQTGGIGPIGDGSLVDLTIGEEVTFRITSTLAEGVSPSVIITDNLPNNAAGQMEYISSNVISVGANLTADTPMPVANVTLPSAVSYDFGQVTNAADGVINTADQIVIEVTGVVTNIVANSGIETLTNNVLVQFNSGISTSASADIEVVEPRMSIDKTSATSSADAGDVVTFVISVDNLLANNSSANAFDVTLTDALPAGLTFSGNLNTDSGLAPDSLAEAGNVITASWASYPLGSDTVISFDVIVDNTVNPQQVIQNTAVIDWTSMPGANADERSSNDSDPHSITISMAGLAKTVSATSEPSTGMMFYGIEDDLTIGEEVTYQFTVSLPEGTTPNAVAFDQLPLAGQVLAVQSSRIVSVGTQLTLGMGAVNDPGNASDNNADTFNDRVEWALGDILNTPDGATNSADELVFEVVAVVNDLAINQDGANDVINQAGLTFTGGNILSTAVVDFVEPELNITKEIVSGTTIADAGDTLTYRLTIDHTTASTADAFNLLITDSLPVPGTNWVADSTLSSTCGATVDSSGEPDIEFNVNQLTLAIGSCVIEYDVTVDVGVMPNSSYTNQAALQYDSTPVFVAGETRRYGDIDTAIFNTTVPALVKITTDSSLAATDASQGDVLLSDLVIGELIDYRITVTFPEGTTDNAVIQDNLPLPASGGSMELISGEVTSIGNMVTTLPGTAVITNSNADAYNDQVVFDFGTVTNPPDGVITADDEIILTITARITDENINVAIEEYINNVTFSYGINEELMDTATIELVEPNLGLTKSMGSPVNGVVPIQLTLTNVGGTAAAYDLTLLDTFDGNVWDLSSIAPTNIPAGFDFIVTPGPGVTESTVTVISSGTPPSSSIEPNEVLVFEFDVAIRDDIPLPSSIDNTATLTEASSLPGADPGERDYSDINAMDTLQLASLDATKADALLVDNGTIGEANPDDTIRYTVVIDNSGSADATSVVFSDAPDVNTTLVVGSVTTTQGLVITGNTAGDGAVLIDIGTVAPMTTVSITFDVVINNPFPQGVTEISNQGLLESNEFTPENTDDPDTGPVDDPTITPIGAGHDLTITKDDGGITAQAGDTIVYTLNYANIGNQNTTGVVITETVPNTTVFNAASSTAGWSCANGSPAGTPCTLAIGDLNGGASGSADFAVDVFIPKPAGVTEILNSVGIGDDGNNGPDDDPTNNNDNENTPVDAAPDLTLAKTSNGLNTAPGGTIVYTLTYQNMGTQGATGVVITDAVPANTTFNATGSTVGWSCADGDPAGTVCSFNVAGVVAAGDPAVGVQFAVTVDNPLAAGVTQVSNAASINDDGNNGADINPNNNDDNEDTNIDAVPDLSISKTDGGITSGPGQTVVYTISYDNVGNQNATGVVITETVPVNTIFNAGASSAGWVCVPDGSAGSACTFNVGILNVGGGSTIDFAVLVNDPLPANVKVVANAVSIGDDGTNGPDPNPGDNTGMDNTPLGAVPDLTINKDDGGITANAGSTIVYTINYANIGNQQSTGIIITETVPLHTSFNSGSSSAGWACIPDNNAGSTCTLAVGSLNGGGDSGTANFAVDVVDPLPSSVTSILNSISIGDDGDNGADADPNNNNNTDDTPVDAAPDLTVIKVDRSDFVNAGGTIIYDITYSNIGSQDATGVVITETVPDNTTYDVSSSSAGWVCSPNNSAGSICILAVGSVAADASPVVVQFAVQVDNPVPAGFDVVTNTISITDDGNNGPDEDSGNNDDNETTNVGAFPDLTISKSDGGVSAGPGQTIVYTLNYANIGDQNSTGVIITETVPANTTHNPTASSVTWNCVPDNTAGSVCEYNVGDLDAGDSGTVTFAVDVDDPLAVGVNLVVNSVSIDDDGTNGPDSDPDNNSDTDDTSLQLEPPVGLKIGEFDADNPRLIHWTVWWFNPNNDRDLPVFVFDDMPEGTSFANGESCVADGTSTCTTPVYNAALDRIELTAVLGEDEGAPADSLPDNLNNEIIIRFDTLVTNIGQQRFVNQAEANWDEDNDGDPVNDATNGQPPIPTDNPLTPQFGDPTVLGGVFPIPTLNWWSMLFLMLVAGFLAKPYLPSRNV